MPRHDDQDFSPLPGRGATPSELWQAITRSLFTTLRVAQPATVYDWKPAIPGVRPATVDLEFDWLRLRAIDNEADLLQGEDAVTTPTGLLARGKRPIYRDRPYYVPSVGAEMSMRGPIAKGTVGLYIVGDRCTDEWIFNGGPIDPGTADMHDLNDGFFLPLFYHGKNTPTIPEDAHQIGPDDGSAGLEITLADQALRVFTSGPTANLDAAAAVQLGNNQGPLLAVARQTDDVGPKNAMVVWATLVETVINGIVLGTFTPANSFATTVLGANGFGSITSGSAKVQSE